MTAPSRTPARTQQQARQLARLLDSQFRVPGTRWRFGLDGLLGLVPGVGDAAGLALSSLVVLRAVALGARGATVGRMVANVAIDAVVGAIPLLGSVFDFAFKANNRNLALLERHGIDPEAAAAESRASLRRTIIAVIVATVLIGVLAVVFVAWLLSLIF